MESKCACTSKEMEGCSRSTSARRSPLLRFEARFFFQPGYLRSEFADFGVQLLQFLFLSGFLGSLRRAVFLKESRECYVLLSKGAALTSIRMAKTTKCSSPVFIDKQFCGDRVHRQQCEGYSQSSNCERVS